jgi:alkylhydroperoxidase family enzyme
MRLTAIENPSHPMLRLAYKRFERQFGKVATPLKVIYARKPRLLPLLMLIDRTADRGISLEPELKLLVFNFVDAQNGCSFCHDYRQAQAVQRQMGMERFAALSGFRTSEVFTGREKAALAYAEAAVEGAVGDSTFQDLQDHFTDTEIVELTWLVAVETYYNLMKRALDISSDGLRELAEERIAHRVTAAVG